MLKEFSSKKDTPFKGRSAKEKGHHLFEGSPFFVLKENIENNRIIKETKLFKMVSCSE